VVDLLGLHGMKLASVELIADTGDRMVKGDEDVVGNATTFFPSAARTLEKEGEVGGVAFAGVETKENENESSPVVAAPTLVDVEAEAEDEENEMEDASED
jgi:hypothetical protein